VSGGALRRLTAERMRAFRGAADCILSAQTADGAIPWFEAGAWDAWNHAECVMALGVMGELEAAERGFEFLSASQEAGGGWLCGYGNAVPMEDRMHIARTPAPMVRDSNFAAYPATALWHHFQLHGDGAFVARHWPMVRAAMAFVLSLQHPSGEISWSQEGFGGDVDDAVLTGNASIYKSLHHAIQLSAVARDPQSHWAAARARIGEAILGRPERFDRIGVDRADFAMDWYYPVLTGVLPAAEARARLAFGRGKFIQPGRGCRCVASQPWVTVAESAELAITLTGLGLADQASVLLGWQEAHRAGDGAYWMGWQFEEDIAWPLEKPTWTQAAMILAHDALLEASPASGVLSARD
jgi:hypothetical protein